MNRYVKTAARNHTKQKAGNAFNVLSQTPFGEKRLPRSGASAALCPAAPSFFMGTAVGPMQNEA